MAYSQPGEAICSRTLSAVANTEAGGKVFPEVPTQNEPPTYVVYELIDGGEGSVLDGRSLLQEYLFRLTVVGRDANTVAGIMTAIHDETTGLPGWRDRTNGVHGVFARGSSASVGDSKDGVRTQERQYSIWFAG